MRVEYRFIGITCLAYLLSPLVAVIPLAPFGVDDLAWLFLPSLLLVVTVVWGTSTIWIARRAGHRWVAPTLTHVCAALTLAGFIPFSVCDYMSYPQPGEWSSRVPWDLWEGVWTGLAITLGPGLIAVLPTIVIGLAARIALGTIEMTDPSLLRLTSRRRPVEWR